VALKKAHEGVMERRLRNAHVRPPVRGTSGPPLP
jgi:hypothetical protein